MAAPRKRTPVKKAAVKKAAPRKKAAPKNTIVPQLAALDAASQKFLADAVMSHPGGCDDGKREFIKRLGLPSPPRMVLVEIEFLVEIPETSPDGLLDHLDRQKAIDVAKLAMTNLLATPGTHATSNDPSVDRYTYDD